MLGASIIIGTSCFDVWYCGRLRLKLPIVWLLALNWAAQSLPEWYIVELRVYHVY